MRVYLRHGHIERTPDIGKLVNRNSTVHDGAAALAKCGQIAGTARQTRVEVGDRLRCEFRPPTPEAVELAGLAFPLSGAATFAMEVEERATSN